MFSAVNKCKPMERPVVEELDFLNLNISNQIEARIFQGINFLASNTHPTKGIQFPFMGYSRTQLNKPNPLPLERFESLLALFLLDGSVSEECSNKWLTCAGPLPPPNQIPVCYNIDNSNMPPDIETTSLLLLVHWNNLTTEHINSYLDLVLKNINEDGILQIYFPPRDRVRIDRCVSATCLTAIYKLKMDAGIMKTEDDLFETLSSKRYLKGSRYYPASVTFLYQVARAVEQSERANARFHDELLTNILLHLCSTVYPMDSAQRILALHHIGEQKNFMKDVRVVQEIENLMGQQMSDGGWDVDALFTTGKEPIMFLGGREMPTVLGVASLRAFASII